MMLVRRNNYSNWLNDWFDNCFFNTEEVPHLTSSLRTPKIFIKEFSYFLMPCHQHCLGVNLLVQR